VKSLLVNVIAEEEVRVAVVDDGELVEYHLEEVDGRSLLGNIYLGRVVNIEASIQSAFVDLGESRAAFMHVSDLHPAYDRAPEVPIDRLGETPGPETGRAPIQDQLRRGQPLLVQVTKEQIGSKGPTVTTFIGLPGRFLVLMAGMEEPGVSKRVSGAQEREDLRKAAESLQPPDNAGIIVRTAARGVALEEFQRDLEALKRVWEEICDEATAVAAPRLLYQEGDLVERSLRDLFGPDIDEVVVDDAGMEERVRGLLGDRQDEGSGRVRSHEGKLSIFRRFGVESEIDNIYDRKVALPSGGSLVIEETEALVAIDVNSGSSREETNLEQTALGTNLEAATEIARQLRLRDIGGVVVCDFIDMVDGQNRCQLEEAFVARLGLDRAKAWVSKLSRFGIIELTRQRLRPSKDRLGRETCPLCSGRGTVRSPRSVATAIFRQLRRDLGECEKEEVLVTVADEVLEVLVNRRRDDLTALEQKHGVRIEVRTGYRRGPERYLIQYR